MKKETTGKQVRDKIIKNIDDKGPECREVVLEWGKEFNHFLEKIIEEHKNYAPKYYIVLYAYKEIWSENVVRTKYIVRKTKPHPEWKQLVYSYDNRTQKLEYHWALPQNEEIGRAILKNSIGFDQQLVKWIQAYFDGTLA